MILATVNGVDITPYINRQSYNINSSREYMSWKDGNLVEHRVYVRKRIAGSFEIALWGKDGMDLSAFLQNWGEAVDNNVITMGVYSMNDAAFKAIQAHYTFTASRHEEMINGNYFDKVTVSIEEC